MTPHDPIFFLLPQACKYCYNQSAPQPPKDPETSASRGSRATSAALQTRLPPSHDLEKSSSGRLRDRTHCQSLPPPNQHKPPVAKQSQHHPSAETPGYPPGKRCKGTGCNASGQFSPLRQRSPTPQRGWKAKHKAHPPRQELGPPRTLGRHQGDGQGADTMPSGAREAETNLNRSRWASGSPPPSLP